MSRPVFSFSKEDIAARGDAIYDQNVSPNVLVEDLGKYVVIDVETGDYEIDADELAAGDRLRSRRPNGQVWLTRVGSRYARRFGSRPLSEV